MSTDIQDVISSWREKLLDISKRNRLINCRTGGKTGVVLLDHPDARRVWQVLVGDSESMQFPWKHELLGQDVDQTETGGEIEAQGGEAGKAGNEGSRDGRDGDDFDACIAVGLDDTDILTRLSDKVLGGRLQRLALNAQTSLQEQGVHTLFVAFGLLRWFESKDSDVPLQAPLLLVPVDLKRESLDSPWQLSVAEEEVIPNHCLAQMLLDSFALQLPSTGDDLMEDSSGLDSYFNHVRKAIESHPRWSVLDTAVLGIFTFQKIAMWKDLGDNTKKIASHPLCQGMALKADQPSAERQSTPRANQLDDLVPPQDTHHILEADSSQLEAIEAVKRGLDLILDGPPGTGKSQTIANLIAECLAQGKSILFVSEKAAALEVVKRRLDTAKLGDFCLECHSHKANKKEVVRELDRCLHLDPEPYEANNQHLEELARTRQRLNAYVRALHRPTGSLRWTAYQVHGRIAALSPTSKSRCAVQDPLGVDASRLQAMVEAVKSLLECSAVIADRGSHPWRGCTAKTRSLTLEDDIRHHLAQLAAALPPYLAAFRDLEEIGLVKPQPSMPRLDRAFELAKAAAAYPSIPAIWFHDIPAIPRHYVMLNQLVQDYREGWKAVACFRIAAIDAPWSQWNQWLAAESAHLLSLGFGPAQGVRVSAARCRQMLPDLRGLTLAAKSLRTLAAQVAEQLCAPNAARLPIHLLPKLADVAALVSQVGVVALSWFDQPRRQELREIAARGGAEAKALAEERKLLDAIFLQVGFEDGVEALLADAASFGSVFKRLLPRWRRLRREVQGLYAGTPPRPASALLRDVERLRAYRRRRTKLLDLGRSMQRELRASEQGTVDWDVLARDLSLVDLMETTVRLPDEAKQALSANQIDKEHLALTATALHRQADAQAQTLSSFAQCFAVRMGLDRGVVIASGPIDSLDAWIDWTEAAVTAVEQRLTVLTAMECVLHDQMDAPVAECPRYAQAFGSLRAQRDEIHAVHRRLRDVGELGGCPEEEDWSGKAQLARWLLVLAEHHGHQIPAPLVAAASDPTIRARIYDTVGRISALRTPQLLDSWRFLCTVFPADQTVSTGIVLSATPAEALIPWLGARASDVARLSEWLTFMDVSTSLDGLGLGLLRDEVVQQTVPLDEVVDAFLSRFYRLWLDASYADDVALNGFRVEDHERLIERFRALDRNHVHEGSKRIRSRRLEQSLGSAARGIDAPDSSELGILLREISKKRRHLPLRQLFNRIPSLLRRIKPCLMMSPLAVSTFLDSDELRFDVVIFDEASQVRPHDAVCAVYRGSQLVVAGDQKQLPPTSFFERQIDANDDEEEEEGLDGISDFESILDVCSTLRMPRKRLQWHYRSRRESLIAFSNEHFYGGELVTFPSVADVDGSSAVRHEYVGKGRWQSGASGGFNSIEARRTADLVMEHVQTNGGCSLGVITMNQRQQLLVIEELEKRRKAHPELEEFFSDSREEYFFVKNLENVQGDERDVIFLSVGYAADQTGNLAMRFGPLNNEGGERRLNVAVTRARTSLVLISSIRAADIDLSRTNAVGVRLLRAYLDYAERGVVALKSTVQDDGARMADSPFETEVAKALTHAGLAVRQQVGCGRFRIDLAIVDPKQPGRYVLGVECDGATYHSSATARDRDRLRQSLLESMGWTMCRIWSTDWVRDRDRQVRRVLEAYKDALQRPVQPVPHRDTASAPKENGVEAIRTPKAILHAGNRPPRYDFSSIDEVPVAVIEQVTQSILQVSGATEQDDLVVEVSRHLGFQRTGSRITKRIRSVLRALLRSGVLNLGDDGRIRIGRTA